MKGTMDMPYVIEGRPPGDHDDDPAGGWMPYLQVGDDLTLARTERDALERDVPGWRGRVQWVDDATFLGDAEPRRGRLARFLDGFRSRDQGDDDGGYDGSATTVRAHSRRGTRGVRRHQRRRGGRR